MSQLYCTAHKYWRGYWNKFFLRRDWSHLTCLGKPGTKMDAEDFSIYNFSCQWSKLWNSLPRLCLSTHHHRWMYLHLLRNSTCLPWTSGSPFRFKRLLEVNLFDKACGHLSWYHLVWHGAKFFSIKLLWSVLGNLATLRWCHHANCYYCRAIPSVSLLQLSFLTPRAISDLQSKSEARASMVLVEI